MEAWGFVSFFCLHMRLACFNNDETIGWVVGAKKKKRVGGVLWKHAFSQTAEGKE